MIPFHPDKAKWLSKCAKDVLKKACLAILGFFSGVLYDDKLLAVEHDLAGWFSCKP